LGKIAVLPPELASQIAAGEIAERPANVVKELLENALDAEATRCDAEIDGGGIARLAITDDGHGMSEEDARLCLERHATSKLRSLSDLARVASYGFRGEALPSIASVSRLSVRSRTRDSEGGIELCVEGGGPPVVREVGASVGTRVEVNDLFYNVPARRKFLRSSATEAGHVTEVVENAALARPDVTFSLQRDGRRVREFLRVGLRGDRVRQVLSDVDLAECGGDRGPLRVEAYLSRPEAARMGAAGLHVFVNGRPVRDRSVVATVAHAYGSVLERGRYPRGVVYLDLPYELVDVNVHPQKTEVRFADPRAVTDALYSLLTRALAGAFSLPSRRPAPAPAPATRNVPASPKPWEESGPVEIEQTAPPAEVSEAPRVRKEGGIEDALSLLLPPARGSAPAVLAFRDSAPAPIQPSPNANWSSLKFIAQLRQTYLLCEGQEGIYVLDQHAAAERVTFTKLRRAYQSRQVPSQALLFPALVEASSEEIEIVEKRGAEIAQVGLDARVRGPETVSIHAIPKLLVRGSPERLLRDLLSEVSRKSERGFSDAIDRALATMACHGSIRAGDQLAASEASALLHALDDADFAGHCPHGRPVVMFIGWAELERKVGRR